MNYRNMTNDELLNAAEAARLRNDNPLLTELAARLDIARDEIELAEYLEDECGVTTLEELKYWAKQSDEAEERAERLVDLVREALEPLELLGYADPEDLNGWDAGDLYRVRDTAARIDNELDAWEQR